MSFLSVLHTHTRTRPTHPPPPPHTHTHYRVPIFLLCFVSVLPQCHKAILSMGTATNHLAVQTAWVGGVQQVAPPLNPQREPLYLEELIRTCQHWKEAASRRVESINLKKLHSEKGAVNI